MELETDSRFYPEGFSGNPPAVVHTQTEARSFLRSVGCKFSNSCFMEERSFVSRKNGHYYEIDRLATVPDWDM